MMNTTYDTYCSSIEFAPDRAVLSTVDSSDQRKHLTSNIIFPFLPTAKVSVFGPVPSIVASHPDQI